MSKHPVSHTNTIHDHESCCVLPSEAGHAFRPQSTPGISSQHVVLQGVMRSLRISQPSACRQAAVLIASRPKRPVIMSEVIMSLLRRSRAESSSGSSKRDCGCTHRAAPSTAGTSPESTTPSLQ